MEGETQTWLALLQEGLHTHPELLLFLALGIGYLIGGIRIGAFSLGPVAGVLFAGIFFGHFGFRITPGAQAVGFAMFIFSVGYQAGPRFFDVLREDGLKYFSLSLVIALTGFAVALAASRLLQLDPGTPAGLLAGGLTSSPTLAAAQEAVRDGSIPMPDGWSAERVINNIATGYAITYIFGLAGLITTIKVLPGLLGIDLVAEARKLERAASDRVPETPFNVTARCYRVTNEAVIGMPLSELKARYWDRVTVMKVYRDGKPMRMRRRDTFRIGDEVEFIGPRDFFTSDIQTIGEEVPPDWSIDMTLDTAQVVVTNKSVFGQKLGRIRIPGRFGVLLTRISQTGVAVPHHDGLELGKGDILTVVGPASGIDTLGKYLGHIERDISETDMVTFAFGIAAGVLVGMLAVDVGGIEIGLGSAGGLLASGLIIGYLRSVRPTFGRLPEAARWILMEFGLLLFMTGIGLRAGGEILETLQKAGPLLVGAGICVTLVPVGIGYLFGRKVLRINPVLLLGAITGAMTSGASLSVITQAAKSAIPALGYTGTYAFASVILTVAGGLIMWL